MRRCLFCGALYHISPQEKRAVRKSAARKCAEAPGGGGIYSFAAGFAALAAGARKRTSREAHTENAISAMGKTIIMISSEMEELLGMADRIIVLAEKRIAGEVERRDFTQEKIMKYASKEV